jgi:Glycosyltransferase
MYPSELNPNFGVFVKNFEQDFPDKTIELVDKTVIVGKKRGVKLLLAYLRFFWEAVNKLNKEEFDLVYVHFLQHSLIPFHFWKNKNEKKIVLNAHGTDILGAGKIYQILRKLNLKIFHRADLVIVPSRFFISKMETLGVKKSILEIYPSGGINSDVFYPLEIKSVLQHKLGYLGRLDKGKGVETLIKAFSKINIHNLHLEICGPGSLLKDLKQLCDSLGIDSQVKFLGNIPQRVLPELFQTWDALVFPSELEESLGLVGLEAMACGLPVIGSGMGGMSTYLFSGENGIVFEPGNVSDLKEKIEYFYAQDQQYRQLISRQAIATANRYHTEKVNSRLRKRIKSLFSA